MEKIGTLLDEIKVLEIKESLTGLSTHEDIELRNKRVHLMNAWSDLKDDF